MRQLYAYVANPLKIVSDSFLACVLPGVIYIKKVQKYENKEIDQT